ncbi:Glucose/arabinose dehydrogenase, beta-propeller fold [Salinimicrobium sediminis]|uniref:Glucose/arabinose dehydrogenase, beta-propeller fold n=1 Tax=Salinimicrobium sediminis TaxID=1343891 RepID=A0A285X771_9FLAO|nr:PQQ-dependent sugar dehydrogenase [Salinimicrobium sediminis]MDX1753118.1 PQQ-dependent sugar dehydrogenase [Salinimicrobium sediminis]SOC81183.1 Glucose/arabinose dehydrogenase, beta-propeller fold [Salinimicrobium sediminis]
MKWKCEEEIIFLKSIKFSFNGIKQFVALLLLLSTLSGCDNDDDSTRREPEPEMAMDLLLVAEGMISPVGLTEAPNDSGWLYVIDQAGMVWIIDENGDLMEEAFLDVSDRMVSLNTNYDERGLLGLAFHPSYDSNGKLYVYYTAPPNAGGPAEGESWNNISRISEFTISATDPSMVNIGSEKIILEVNQPQGNHEGGTIAFGIDGYLYISIGDGGNSNDVAPGHVEDWYEVNAGGNGQDIEANLLGDILRIDIDGGSPYTIPTDNPFVGQTGLDEIYAYGFRNPFRFSFDMGGSNSLIVGDAGQNLYEEINLVQKGGNYGWNVKEGTICFDASNNENILDSCPDVDVHGNELVDPVIEIANASNPGGGITVTIIGGNVYRGSEIPELNGRYIFGSFSSDFEPKGELFVATPSGTGPWSYESLNLESYPDNLGYFVKGFGQDMNGEVYVTVSSTLGPDGTTGKIFKIAMVEQ